MFRQLLPYTKKYRKEVILTPLLILLEAATNVITPRLMANIVNYGVAEHNMDFVVKNGIIMLLFSLFGIIVGSISCLTGPKAGFGVSTELRRASYEAIQGFSFRNIDQLSVPSLINRLTTDADIVGRVYMMCLRRAFRGPFLLLFACIFAFQLNPQLTMVFLAAIPLSAFLLYKVLDHSFPLFTDMRNSLDHVNGTVEEQLQAIRVIKSLNRQDYAAASFDEDNQDVQSKSVRALSQALKIQPILLATISLVTILILGLGGWNITVGNMMIGDLIAFLTYLGQIGSALMLLSGYFVSMVYARASLNRIMEVIHTQSEQKEAAHPIKEVKDGSVVFDHVSFKYPAFRSNVLDDISLHFESGQRIGIIGPTGSSKSTLVQLIPRLYDVERGTVYVGGERVEDYDMASLRGAIGFVLQKSILLSGTIRSNMEWGKEDASDEEIIRALQLAQAWEFVRLYPDGIDHPVEQGGSNFSGGQKQRLSLARALLTQPKILILDDAASAVDTATDLKIRRMLRTELPEVTQIIISQRVDSIRDADQIVVMNEGRVDAVGSHQELLKASAIYRDIYETQQGGLE